MTKDRVCANDTALSRRSLLAALPAAGVALASPALAVGSSLSAEAEDPVLPIYRKWCAARAEWLELSELEGNGDFEHPQSLAAEKIENDAFFAMVEMSPTSLEGVAAMAHVFWEVYGPCMPDDAPDYVSATEEPENKLIAAIWRCASGENGLPRQNTY